MPQLKFSYIRKELHSCKAYMIFKMVLDKMFYSKQMVDEKSFRKCFVMRQTESALNFLLFWMAFGFLR